MNEIEVDMWADALLLKIHAITGWNNPENEILNILTDQFKKKLCESYPNCNTDEIEYAFRAFGSSVKDWGKQMNLSLIDEVMNQYLQQRKNASIMEESMRKAEEQKPNIPEINFSYAAYLRTELMKKLKKPLK